MLIGYKKVKKAHAAKGPPPTRTSRGCRGWVHPSGPLDTHSTDLKRPSTSSARAMNTAPCCNPTTGHSFAVPNATVLSALRFACVIGSIHCMRLPCRLEGRGGQGHAPPSGRVRIYHPVLSSEHAISVNMCRLLMRREAARVLVHECRNCVTCYVGAA